jgi:putative hydrolase of the HAD superfamily
MLILFDIDDTLLDHGSAERSAATLLHRNISAAVSPEEFLVRWASALERHFARYLAGEASYQAQRRDRVREVVDSSLSDEAADRVFAGYLANYEATQAARTAGLQGIWLDRKGGATPQHALGARS